jgi:hypothetical protein
MASWASKSTKVLLRVVLTLLLLVVGLDVGIKLAPKLAQRTGDGRRKTVFGPRSPVSRAAQPDWGGARLSFPARSTAGIVDSVSSAVEGDRSKTRTWSGTAGGVVLRQKSGTDYALTLALPASGQPGRSGVFELPSSGHFREQLFPEGLGTRSETLGGFRSCPAPPATDIPLYPWSSCRMQVGRGTACFVGFYTTRDSLEAVRSFYVRTLSRLGWERVTEDEGRKTEDGRRGLETFAKSNEDRTVVVQLREQDSVTTRIGLVAMSSGTGTRSELPDNSVMSTSNERK